MVLSRRLLTGLLALALAQFSAVATAPAHAHDAGDAHGVREVVLAHADEAPGHHHDGGDHHGPDTEPASIEGAGVGGSAPLPEAPNHGEHAHVHACPQFAPLNGEVTAVARALVRELGWPAIFTPAVRHSSSPPLRPPRAIL